MNPESQATFRALGASAAAGELYLAPAAAQEAADACQERINWLIRFKGKSTTLAHLSAFGDFGSAQALGQKFQDLAAGPAGSFEDIVQGHIDTVKAMKEAIEKAGAAYNSADEATRDAIDKAGRGRD